MRDPVTLKKEHYIQIIHRQIYFAWLPPGFFPVSDSRAGERALRVTFGNGIEVQPQRAHSPALQMNHSMMGKQKGWWCVAVQRGLKSPSSNLI